MSGAHRPQVKIQNTEYTRANQPANERPEVKRSAVIEVLHKSGSEQRPYETHKECQESTYFERQVYAVVGIICSENPKHFQHPVDCGNRRADNRSQESPKRELQLAQASIPSGFSTRRLNACISLAPSAPSMARWSKLPVALITVAIWRLSLIT